MNTFYFWKLIPLKCKLIIDQKQFQTTEISFEIKKLELNLKSCTQFQRVTDPLKFQ